MIAMKLFVVADVVAVDFVVV